MRRYRLTILLASLLIGWLVFGQRIIEWVTLTANELTIRGLNLSGRILYTQGANGIWQHDLATRETELWWQAADGGFVGGIAVSPNEDTVAIAFAPEEQAGVTRYAGSLYVSRMDSLEFQPLLMIDSNDESIMHPVWSPDGEWIYFTRVVPIQTESGATVSIQLNLERVKLDGTHEIFIEHAEQLAFSPDGTQITYIEFDLDTYGQSIFIADADGSNGRHLLEPTFYGMLSPRFTPDGEHLIFSVSNWLEDDSDSPTSSATWGISRVQAHGPPWSIWQMTLDGDNLTRLTPSDYDDPNMQFSPDGQAMGFLDRYGVHVLVDGQVYQLAESIIEGEMVWLE